MRYPTRLSPPFIRTYATQPRTRHFKQPPLSLDHFLLRQRALALYRDIIRSCRRLPDPKAREEMRN